MPRLHPGETPEYVSDTIASAKPIGSQLGVTAGLLIMLLIALSAMEAPMLSRDAYVNRAGEAESTSPNASWLCMIGEQLWS
jgi:hypothetical protein